MLATLANSIDQHNMQKPNRKPARTENLLRTFWVILTFVMLGVAVTLFEAREDSRALVFSKKSTETLDATVRKYPGARTALEAVMFCVGKGYLKIDKGFDEEDVNRPRQVCPPYAKALEATHPSPIGMHELSEAYGALITGLKANL